jgi:N-dimethylarginine dimethylaminohydrolase
MADSYGCRSMTGTIRRIILKHPADAFVSQGRLEANWQRFNFSACPDYQQALREFDTFEAIIKSHVPKVHYLPHHESAGLDSIYTHDPVKITPHGAILMNMGKELRRHEPGILREFLQELDVPVLGEIGGEGRMEGGDIAWLDEKTAAVAHGYRTNHEGILQFRELTRDFIEEFIIVPLPHAEGPAECLHLMSVISMVDTDLAVVYPRYMPVFFRELLLHRGIRMIEVDDAEYTNLGCNVLALAPGKCLMLSGNPVTAGNLRAAGVEVHEYYGLELSVKGAGGPTCLTCPVLRG